MKTGVIDYAVYERGKEYLGTANVQLPDIAQKLLSYYAAGVGGDIDTIHPNPGTTAARLRHQCVYRCWAHNARIQPYDFCRC